MQNRVKQGTGMGLICLLGLLVVTGVVAASDVSEANPALINALKEAGWEAQSHSDGSIELRVPSPLLPEQVNSGAPGLRGGEKPGGGPETVDWDRLRESGWRVERAPDGSILLYPPTRGGDMETDPRPSQGSVRRSLDEKLEDRGWRVRQSADGSLLLVPRREKPHSPDKAFPEPCPGTVAAPVRDSVVALPVDRWAEAKVIAESWLAALDEPALAIGRIRRVFRVYLVSIVDSKSPHGLRHQIAVNAGDGSVIVLN